MLNAYIYLAYIQLSQVGEFSTIVCTSSSDTSIVLAIFNLWIAKHGFEVGSHLGNCATGHPSKPQGWRSSHLQSRPQLVRTLHRNTSRKRFLSFPKNSPWLLLMHRKWALSPWWRLPSMWQQLTSWGRFWKACSTGWRNTSKNSTLTEYLTTARSLFWFDHLQDFSFKLGAFNIENENSKKPETNEQKRVSNETLHSPK